MRVIFINRFYWPDEPATAQLLTDLAETLAARGHAVLVIASQPSGAGAARTETRHGVEVRRVRGTRWGRRSLAGRTVDFATFLFGALWRLLLTARRGDAVVALTDPPMIGTLAWPVARLRGARLLQWIQDIYPEVALELTGHRWLRLLRPLRNLVWRRSDRCVTLGDDMAAVVRGAGVNPQKISIAPNWAPSGLVPPPPPAVAALKRAWGLEGKFVAAYSGNLGRVHDLAPLLDVADALRHDRDIALVFVGTGAHRTRLETAATARRLDNVRFVPPQPRETLAASLSVGDVHFVTLLPGCERCVFPSKLYGIAAVGRPVIFIGPTGCEVARVVTGRGLGRAFSRTEAAAIADTVRALRDDGAMRAAAGRAALAFASANGGPAQAADRWEALLEPTPAISAPRAALAEPRVRRL